MQKHCLLASIAELAILLSCLMLTACGPMLIAGTAAGVSIIHDRRSAGTVIDDNTIELVTYGRLGEAPFYNTSHISTTAYNGYVLLVGQTPTQQDKQHAGKLASQVDNVKKVYNELRVGKVTGLAQRTKDAWITSAVKTRLVTDSNIDPTRVKVVTENGTVFLLGLVTHDEALTATQNAKKVSGVKKIIRIFEYLQI